MKTCFACKQPLPLDQYNKKTAAKDGLQPWCRECNRERSKKYYRENWDAHRALMKVRNAAAILRNQKFLGDYLTTHHCVDCGESDIRVLDFDHINNDKLNNVSELVRQTFSISTIELEIAKCEVRCANCHRKITNVRADNWRQKYIEDRL